MAAKWLSRLLQLQLPTWWLPFTLLHHNGSAEQGVVSTFCRTHVVCAMLPAPRLANGFFVYLVGSPGLGAPRVKPHLIYLYRSCARLRRWPFHLLLTWTTTTRTTITITAATARTIKTTRTTTARGWGAGSVLGLLLAADSYLIVALIKLLSLLKGTF